MYGTSAQRSLKPGECFILQKLPCVTVSMCAFKKYCFCKKLSWATVMQLVTYSDVCIDGRHSEGWKMMSAQHTSISKGLSTHRRCQTIWQGDERDSTD
eukprot:4400587-Amphidinium_carterae.1